MSSASCILSRSAVDEGDRVVAVLATPVPPPRLFQQYAPSRTVDAATAASFPIRGAYVHFGRFDPDPDQPAVRELLERLGMADWASMQEAIHEKGIERLEDRFPEPDLVTRAPAAFAFAAEDVHDALAVAIDPGKAFDAFVAAARACHDDDRETRSKAAYGLIRMHEEAFPFGRDMPVAATSDGTVGAAVMSRTIRRLCEEVLDAPGGGAADVEGRAGTLFRMVADLTSFETALMRAGAVLAPSPLGGPTKEAEMTAASATMRRLAAKLADDDHDDGTLASFRSRAEGLRAVADVLDRIGEPALGGRRR